jgi:hypothetical protein
VGDLTCLYDSQQHALHTLVALGPNVCGHGGLVHGGMSATVRLAPADALLTAAQLLRNTLICRTDVMWPHLDNAPRHACTHCMTAAQQHVLNVDMGIMLSRVSSACFHAPPDVEVSPTVRYATRRWVRWRTC